MTLLVRHIPTGKVGEIPEDKFDPRLFQALDQPQQQETSQQQPQNLAQRIGGGVADIAADIVQPFTRTGSRLADLGVTQAQALTAGAVGAFNPDAGAQIASKDIFGTQSRSGELIDDKEQVQKEALQDALEISSYLVPFGKARSGAGLLERGVTKYALPGAVTGAMITPETTEALTGGDADLAEIAGSAAIGAAIPTVLGGAGSALRKLKGLEDVGTSVRGSVRDITLPPQVGGAQREEAVSQTLDKLGIRGKVAQQYKQLQDAMDSLSDDIQKAFQSSPKNTKLDTLVDSLESNLEDTVLSGNLKRNNVQREISGFLDDFLKISDESANITDVDLYNLKKKLNKQYGRIAKKLDKGTPLNAREEVIMSARNAVDDVLTSLHPNVKEATIAQSHLFDAATSLGRNRKNPPTLRILGISTPKTITEGGVDLTGRALQSVGESAASVAPGATTAKIGSQLGARVATQDEQASEQPTSDVTEQALPFAQGSTQQQTLTGRLPQEHYQAYQKALAAGDTASAKQIRQAYEDELAFQESMGGGRELTQQQAKFVSASNAANDALQLLESGNVASGPGTGIAGSIGGKLGLNSAEQDEYRSNIAFARTMVRNALLGGAVSEGEAKSLEDAIPEFSDSPSTARTKLQNFIRLTNEFGLQNQGSDMDTIFNQALMKAAQ